MHGNMNTVAIPKQTIMHPKHTEVLRRKKKNSKNCANFFGI